MKSSTKRTDVLPLLFLLLILTFTSGCGGENPGASNFGQPPQSVETILIVTGKVIDRDSGKVLNDAKITFPEGKEITCDENGNFQIELPIEKDDVFVVSAPDYKATLVSAKFSSARDNLEIPLISEDSDEVPLVVSFYDNEVKMPVNQKKTGNNGGM